MADFHYKHPRLAALYDHDSGWSESREFYLRLAGNTPEHILDIGCGTGLICNAYAAKAHKVTGVDPSPTMLNIARSTGFGKNITWVEAFAQNFKLDQKFDLIIMTGHTFQVLLTDEDVLSMLKTVKKHLKPYGKFVFESRNPEIDWATKWNHNYTLEIKDQKIRVETKVLSDTDEIITFDHYYDFGDERLVSRSNLRFMSKDRIAACITQAGLSLKNIVGDWEGNDFHSTKSSEMIFTLHVG